MREPSDADGLLQRGAELGRAGRHAEALAAFNAAILVEPTNAQAHYLRAVALTALGSQDDALSACASAIDLDPAHVLARVTQGDIFGGRGEHEKAVSAYRSAIAVSPRNIRANHGLAFHLDELGRYEDAAEAYAQAIEIDPKNVHAYINRGVTLGKAGHLDEALASFDRAIQLDPSNVNAHKNRGFALYEGGHYGEAQEAYSTAARLAPRDADAWHWLALTCTAQGQYREAVAPVSRLVALDPANASAHYRLADVLVKLRRHAAALRSYQRAAELDHRMAAAHEGCGIALCELGRLELGLEAIDRADELCPNNATTQKNRGTSLLRLGRFEEALAAYDRALQLDPSNVRRLADRCVPLVRLGRFEEAVAACDRALEVDPDSAEVHLTRGVALSALRRHRQALREYQTVVNIDPANIEARVNRGNGLYRAHRHEEALAEYDHAADLDPGSPGAHLGRGNALHALGLFKRAIAAYETSIDLDPFAPAAWFGLASSLKELGHYERADEARRKGIQFKNVSPLDHLLRGMQLEDQEQEREALAAYDRALRLDGTLVVARSRRAALLLGEGFPDEALRDFRMVQDPEGMARAWLELNEKYLGWWRQARRPDDEALVEDAVRNAKENYEAARTRLRFLIERKDLQNAWAEVWLRLVSPLIDCGRHELAWDVIQAVKGRTFLEESAAKASWAALLAIAPELAAAQHELEQIEARENDVAAALKVAEAALKRDRELAQVARAHPEIGAATFVAPVALGELQACLRDDEVYVDLVRVGDVVTRILITSGGLSAERVGYEGVALGVTFAGVDRLNVRCSPEALLGTLPAQVATLLVSPGLGMARVPWQRLAGERRAVALVPAAGMLAEARSRRRQEVDCPYLGVACNADGRIGGVDAEVRTVGQRYFGEPLAPGVVHETETSTALFTTHGGFRLLHLACHAGPRGLRLHAGEERWTTPVDLLGLGLRADLVVCTGCRAGEQDDEDAANEFLGIARQFLAVTGARAAVVSLEPVQDAVGVAFADLLCAALTGGTPICGWGPVTAPPRPLPAGLALALAQRRLVGMTDGELALALVSTPAANAVRMPEAVVSATRITKAPPRDSWFLLGDPGVMLVDS